MLEESIAELTKAVLALTYALNQTNAGALIGSAPVLPEIIEKVIEVPNETDFVKKVAEAVRAEKASKTTTDTSPPSESESAPVTYDDVKKATNALSAAKGRDVTIDALSRFGAKRATELDEGQWADYIAYTETVIADE